MLPRPATSPRAALLSLPLRHPSLETVPHLTIPQAAHQGFPNLAVPHPEVPGTAVEGVEGEVVEVAIPVVVVVPEAESPSRRRQPPMNE